MEEVSEIQGFYKGQDVFVTGGTGFLGKLLVEKLLRTCMVNKIYLLIRCKKGKSQLERLHDIFEVALFEPLKKQQPDYMSRVVLIHGDCVEPKLGMSQEDIKTIQKTVSLVFHVAATVRFDQKLRIAANINVRATQDLLKISREMPNLKSFVYVSTAYSNCPRTNIGEEFYKPTMGAEKLFKMLDLFDDDYIDAFTPKLIGDWPNTYAYTKCISEDVIRTETSNLPVAVVRPSIVISTYKEPFPGWIDNYYGAMGVSHGAALGILRTLHAIPENHTDIVPADYVINTLLVTAWETANKFKEDQKEVEIYNYVSTPENPIDWKTYMDKCQFYGNQVPSPLVIWHFIFRLNRYKWKHNLDLFLLHWIPAYIVDFGAVCLRKKPLLVDGYKKIHKFIDVISFFTVRQWTFNNDHTQGLWKKISDKDKKLFAFSMGELDWETFFSTYMMGGRVYLIKDPLDTVPAGVKHVFKLKVLHYIIVGLLWSLMFYFFYSLWNMVV